MTITSPYQSSPTSIRQGYPIITPGISSASVETVAARTFESHFSRPLPLLIKDRVRHGQIELILLEGNYIKGDWIEDQIHPGRKGTIIWSNGERYDGEWTEYKLYHGQGAYTSPDGSQYVGNWVQDEKSGHGTATWPNGDKYVGEWKQDKRSGHRTATSLNGDKYVGEWVQGERSGHGTATWSDGSQHEGPWRNGVPQIFVNSAHLFWSLNQFSLTSPIDQAT
jgi:hypothetical protein